MVRTGRPVKVSRFEREPELVRRHRTTARGALFLLIVAGLLAGTAAARSGGTTKPIVFPVLGAAHYVDDFGAHSDRARLARLAVARRELPGR